MIPVIDLSRHLDPASVIQQLRDAAAQGGFFQVVGHGVPHDLIDEVRLAARRFFDRPQSEKSAACCLSLGEVSNWRGYEHFAADGREAFEIGLEYTGQDHTKRVLPLQGENRWPANDPDFKRTVSVYHVETVAFSRRLLGVLALALGLQEGYFDAQVREPLAQLRLWNYPRGTGLAPHKDHGFLTVLLQDEQCGGLQVLRRVLPSPVRRLEERAGSETPEPEFDLEPHDIAEEIAAVQAESQGEEGPVWLDVPLIPYAFVINVGRLFEIFSQQVFPATIHRVRFAPEAGHKQEISLSRISLALFFAPGWEVVIEPPPELLVPGIPRPRPVQSGPHVLFGYRWQQYVNTGEIEDVAAAKRRALAETVTSTRTLT